ncbi:DUF3466 family protein [Photobacterium nomapromontoriensis]|uniref:DUF3466 family protein n=1 Tax=Photobacterium nomapromontoriensis TaxID=2910237 RepID=UPI003D0A4627
MQHKTLKLSTLAMLIASATGANAAVYKVVEVTGDTSVASQNYYDLNASDTVEFYGQGISASSGADNCFDGACSADNYTVFGESRLGSDGIPYRDVVPYISDNRQEINDEDRLFFYCERNIGPNTCDNWARTQYYGKGYNSHDIIDRTGFGGLVREQEAWTKNYYANATAMLGTGSFSPVETFASKATGYDAAIVPMLGSIVDNDGVHSSTNTVINSVGSNFALGIASGAYFEKDGRFARQFNKRGFVNYGDPVTPSQTVRLDPFQADPLVKNAGQSLAFDAVEYPAGSLLVVGSASFGLSNMNDDNKVPDNNATNDPTFNDSEFNNCAKLGGDLDKFYATKECQLTVFANDAVFWSVDGTTGDVTSKLLSDRVASNGAYATLDPDDDGDRSYQAGARAVSLVGDADSKKPVVVGFTTDSVYKTSIDKNNEDYYAIRAAVWELKPNTTDVAEKAWKRTIIPGMPMRDSDNEQILHYSMATDINNNDIVIGVAKNSKSTDRSYAERMFVYNNKTKPTSPTFLDSSVSPIFFTGANGYAAAINNHDQIVGKVDAETVNQVDGRFRRQRAFTYAMGDLPGSAALKKGDVYLLDDLTNGGADSATANQYRIFEATGINDAGVISATAFKCEGGYDNLTNESLCKDGEANSERTVAVKLIPIAASENPTVEVRPAAETVIKRNGASLGMLSLVVLGWLGFRRRK